MKQFFILSILLLLLSSCDATCKCVCDAIDAPVLSPSSEPPVLSPSSEPPVLSPSSEPPVLSPSSEPPVLSPSSEPPMLSPSSAPSNNDCSTVIYGMMDCLSFLTVGSTDSPTKSCCDGVKIVLEYNSSCLCVALESSIAMGFNIINSRALAMPSTCNIPIDPHCDVASSPAASTPIAPKASPTKPPTTSPSSSSPPARTTPTSPSAEVRHSSSARTASPPTVSHSTPTVNAPTPAMIAPSPSKSGTKNLSVSRLFLVIMMISSFVYVLA